MAQALSRLCHSWERIPRGSTEVLCWMPAQTQACGTLSRCCCCTGWREAGPGKGCSALWAKVSGGTGIQSADHEQAVSSWSLAGCLYQCGWNNQHRWLEGELGSDQLPLPPLPLICLPLLSFLLAEGQQGLLKGPSLTGVTGERTARVVRDAADAAL